MSNFCLFALVLYGCIIYLDAKTIPLSSSGRLPNSRDIRNTIQQFSNIYFAVQCELKCRRTSGCLAYTFVKSSRSCLLANESFDTADELPATLELERDDSGIGGSKRLPPNLGSISGSQLSPGEVDKLRSGQIPITSIRQAVAFDRLSFNRHYYSIGLEANSGPCNTLFPCHQNALCADLLAVKLSTEDSAAAASLAAFRIKSVKISNNDFSVTALSSPGADASDADSLGVGTSSSTDLNNFSMPPLSSNLTREEREEMFKVLNDTFKIERQVRRTTEALPSLSADILRIYNNHSYRCFCADYWLGPLCERPVRKSSKVLKRVGWTEWADWRRCSKSCGIGYQTRERDCINQVTNEVIESLNCDGAPLEYLKCEGIACPRWLKWSEWSPCSTESTCGIGTKHRNRTCVHGNGQPIALDECQGNSSHSSICFYRSCEELLMLGNDGMVLVYNDTDYVSHGVLCPDKWTRRESDTVCRILGSSSSVRSKKTRVKSPRKLRYMGGLFECNNKDKKKRISSLFQCNHTDVKVTKKPIACKSTSVAAATCVVDGGWTAWAPWTACSTTCDDGISKMLRKCDFPKPAYGGRGCKGTGLRTRRCNLMRCAVDGYWLEWSAYSACTLTCGGGLKTRNRQCHEPINGGEMCPGPSEESPRCNINPCPVDGVWNSWSKWDTCSLTCAGGQQQRERSCEGPFYEGQPCRGDPSEQRQCNSQPCPVDAAWTSWTEWSKCSVTCEDGVITRRRQCSGQKYGGSRTCSSGNSTEMKTCHVPTPPYCPIDGSWTTWSAGRCSKECGGGLRNKTRECLPPKFGGKDCKGVDNVTFHEAVEACNQQPCIVAGEWSQWSWWSACSVSCGEGGEMSRYRMCGGRDSHGRSSCADSTNPIDDRQVLQCSHPSPCPIPGDWLAWSEWSMCTKLCGTGTRERNRVCDWESYGNLTAPCEGSPDEIADCHTWSCDPQPSCSHWRELGLNQSGLIEIDPDGSDAGGDSFEVFCNMSAPEALTIIGHDKEREYYVTGYEASYEWELSPNYNTSSFDQVVQLVKKSANCKQYLKWACHSAAMSNDQGALLTFFLNRDGEEMKYWAGGDKKTGGCRCGKEGNCQKAGVRCNCDIDDNVWRYDDGYVENIEDLPIKSVTAGDTGNKNIEQGKMTVGVIECWGTRAAASGSGGDNDYYDY